MEMEMGEGWSGVRIVLSGAWKGRWAFVDGSVNVSGVEFESQ
jgi:hypothetical protein